MLFDDLICYGVGLARGKKFAEHADKETDARGVCKGGECVLQCVGAFSNFRCFVFIEDL